MILLVGITGYKKSGKNTAANFIAKNFPSHISHTIAFADSLKKEVATLFKITIETLEAEKDKFRSILQEYGQKEKETRGQYVWVKEVANKLNTLDSTKPQLVIIPDVRFPFEATWIKELGGFLIKIERFDSTDDLHPSETEVNKIKNSSYYLPNKGSLQDLERECKWVSEFIKTHYKI